MMRMRVCRRTRFIRRDLLIARIGSQRSFSRYIPCIPRHPMPARRITFVALLAAFIVAVCSAPLKGAWAQNSAALVRTAAAGCSPLDTCEPNAPDQRPAFPGQTRACAIKSNVAFDVVVLAKGLNRPWAVELLPGGDVLITEKPGRLRIVTAAGVLGQPISGVPAVDARGQGGLLDVALSPTFESDRAIRFLNHAEPRQGGNETSVARGVLSADQRSLEEVRVILRTVPTYDGTMHFGSRLRIGPTACCVRDDGRALGRTDAKIRAAARRAILGKTARIPGQTARHRLTTRSSESRARSPRSGRSVIGTCRLPRSIQKGDYGW